MDWAGKMFGLDAGGFLGNTGIGGGCIMVRGPSWLPRRPACAVLTRPPNVLQGSASEACLTIAVGARERALLTLHQQELAAAGLPETETSEIPPDVRERLSQRLVMYGSTQTHSIGAKAASILGHRFRALEVTQADDLSLRGETLRLALEEDTAKGLIPFMLVGTVGTTSSGAVDAIGELGRVVRDYPTVHFHVDAAWAGISYACPELREKGRLAECNEFASSFSTNAHKWGLTNFDCTGVWVKDRTLLTNALSLTPEVRPGLFASSSGLVADEPRLPAPSVSLPPVPEDQARRYRRSHRLPQLESRARPPLQVRRPVLLPPARGLLTPFNLSLLPRAQVAQAVVRPALGRRLWLPGPHPQLDRARRPARRGHHGRRRLCARLQAVARPPHVPPRAGVVPRGEFRRAHAQAARAPVGPQGRAADADGPARDRLLHPRRRRHAVDAVGAHRADLGRHQGGGCGRARPGAELRPTRSPSCMSPCALSALPSPALSQLPSLVTRS